MTKRKKSKLEFIGSDDKDAFYRCLCGKELSIPICNIHTSSIKSCGCLKKKPSEEYSYKHGKSRTYIYYAWSQMKDRCYRSNNKAYKSYGGRGITVCDRWLGSFENFYEDMGDRPSNEHSLDRINVNGNYCKENCKWSTRKEQSLNKTNTVVLTVKGVEKPLLEWCRLYNLQYNTVKRRIFNYGWDPLEALTKRPKSEPQR